MPATLAQPLLHQRPVLIWRRCLLALVAASIAQQAGRDDIGPSVRPTLLLGQKVLSSALAMSGAAKGKTVELGEDLRDPLK